MLWDYFYCFDCSTIFLNHFAVDILVIHFQDMELCPPEIPLFISGGFLQKKWLHVGTIQLSFSNSINCPFPVVESTRLFQAKLPHPNPIPVASSGEFLRPARRESSANTTSTSKPQR